MRAMQRYSKRSGSAPSAPPMHFVRGRAMCLGSEPHVHICRTRACYALSRSRTTFCAPAPRPCSRIYEHSCTCHCGGRCLLGGRSQEPPHRMYIHYKAPIACDGRTRRLSPVHGVSSPIGGMPLGGRNSSGNTEVVDDSQCVRGGSRTLSMSEDACKKAARLHPRKRTRYSCSRPTGRTLRRLQWWFCKDQSHKYVGACVSLGSTFGGADGCTGVCF